MHKNTPDTFSVVLFTAVWLLTLSGDFAAAGWGWDFANGLGFAAIAGFICLCVQSAGRVPVRYHQTFSYVVLLLIALHAIWLLITDRIILEYLKPGAPTYMWAGLLSFFLVLFLVISARPMARKKAFVAYLSFRNWHRGLSCLAIGAALFHILGSGFYIRDAWQYVLLTLVVLPALMPTLWVRLFSVRGYSSIGLISLAVCLAAAISISRNAWQP